MNCIIKANAWDTLYKVYSETLKQDELDLMDSILKSVEFDGEEHAKH